MKRLIAKSKTRHAKKRGKSNKYKARLKRKDLKRRMQRTRCGITRRARRAEGLTT